MTEPKSPLAVLFETLLFAPVGLAVMLHDELPKLAERGKQHLDPRVRTARMVGEFAVKAGQKEVERRLAGRTKAPTSTDTPADRSATAPGVDGSKSADSEASTSTSTEAAQGIPPTLQIVEEPAPSVDDLAIPGYDSLAASQVVDRLAGLTSDELDAVRRYEAAGRRRRTILHRIDQLVA